jgi:hypothetical protein
MSEPHLVSRSVTTSRYAISPVVVDAHLRPGTRRQEVWERLNINLADAQRHVVIVSDLGRLDLISFNEYGTPSLWWVVALVNNIKNQFEDMRVGTTLYLPRIDRINEAINDRAV